MEVNKKIMRKFKTTYKKATLYANNKITSLKIAV